jgi:hypothetical protein
MLPINETVKIDGQKYKIESVKTGYLVNDSFIVYENISGKWDCAEKDVPYSLVLKIGKQIDELIWFRANGV